MTKEALKSAVHHAQEFVDRATVLMREEMGFGRTSGSVRRQSMELTNALVRLRRSGRFGHDDLGYKK